MQKARWPYLLLILCAGFLLLLLAGCVSGGHWTWTHPAGYGGQQLAHDREVCLALANREAGRNHYRYRWSDLYWGSSFYPYPGFYQRPYFDWYRYDYGFRYQDELRRFFRICMEAKGWQRVRLEPAAGE